MSEPLFLTEEQILALLKAELPQGLYSSDRADSSDPAQRSYSSAELRAMAKSIADIYAGLKAVYSDKFIGEATDSGLNAWESVLFTTAQDASLNEAQKRGNTLAKLRSSQGISWSAISSLVGGVLAPLNIAYDVSAWSGTNNGGWILDYSPLDVGTWLNEIDPLLGARRDVSPLDCAGDYAGAGLSQEDYLAIQKVAYTYEVRIFGHIDEVTYRLLDQLLTAAEPARSAHLILNDCPEYPSPDTTRETSIFESVIDWGTF